MWYWEENISKQIETPSVLTVFLTIPLNKLPYKTAYEPQQEEQCEDNYRKRCFIEFKQSASDETVQFCHTPLVRNCDIPGPEVCSTEYRSECTTRYWRYFIIREGVILERWV